MGTPRFACKPLAALVKSKHELLAVVTGPDEPLRRGRGTAQTAVCSEAIDHSIPILKPKKLKSKKLREQLAELQPDLFVVVAFRILPRSLYTLPKLGSINIHGSLLPKYRGAAPINWALINGDTETGLTSFVLNDTVDTGDVILQEKVVIEPRDNFDSLYARMSDRCGSFMLRSIDLLADDNFQPTVQDNNLSSPAPKITPENAMIDFGFPARNVVNFVRGLSSVPGAYTFFRGDRVKILECSVADGQDNPGEGTIDSIGEIIPDKKKLLVRCAGSVVEITRIMPQGKKTMDGSSFNNGYHPADGERFGEIPEQIENKL